MLGLSCLLHSLFGHAGRFRRDENGAMAMMMGLTAIPLIFAVGAGIDYGSANMVKSKLDAIADTAALSAVDHLAITGTAAAAQTTAQSTFNAQAVNIANLSDRQCDRDRDGLDDGPHRRG